MLVLERDSAPGGLAGTFEFHDGVRIEKFYHHWFTNDRYVPRLVAELGLSDHIVRRPSRTGLYYGGRNWRLSTPLDLMRFTPLPILDRIRLGLLVARVRAIKDWREIEHLSIREWLEPICGSNAYRVVWEPLINAKFSIYADAVGAVWFWKKLVLRGSTRGKTGAEELAYFRGGFGRLSEAIVDAIRSAGGDVELDATVQSVRHSNGQLQSVVVRDREIAGRQFLFTPALPIIADILKDTGHDAWIDRLLRVRYLGNICLVLELNQSLSDTYWLNVNDPGFPFVGIIEHTNFDPPENYRGAHIAYLSRYVAKEDAAWAYSDKDYFEFAFGHLQRMFPSLGRDWITEYRVWRTEFAQPVTERNYSQYVPGRGTPFENAWISTMAQIYPEDRGTNYAIRDGQQIALEMLSHRTGSS